VTLPAVFPVVALHQPDWEEPRDPPASAGPRNPSSNPGPLCFVYLQLDHIQQNTALLRIRRYMSIPAVPFINLEIIKAF